MTSMCWTSASWLVGCTRNWSKCQSRPCRASWQLSASLMSFFLRRLNREIGRKSCRGIPASNTTGLPWTTITATFLCIPSQPLKPFVTLRWAPRAEFYCGFFVELRRRKAALIEEASYFQKVHSAMLPFNLTLKLNRDELGTFHNLKMRWRHGTFTCLELEYPISNV